MAPRRRKERNASDIGLSQPDRSAPSDQTLLQLAQERGLFEQASKQARRKSRELRTESSEDEDDESGFSPTAQRIAEAIMWSISLAMLHFTLDLFVQHQYAISIQWPKILARSGQAFLGARALMRILSLDLFRTIVNLPQRQYSSFSCTLFIHTPRIRLSSRAYPHVSNTLCGKPSSSSRASVPAAT